MNEASKPNRLRRWRVASVLAVGVAIGTVMMATPAVGHVGGTVSHLWGHIKPKADARYLQQATVIVVASGTVSEGSFDAMSVSCPDGYRAVGGGVDPNNVLHGRVTASAPMIEGERTLLTADGSATRRATGWWGGIYLETTSTATSMSWKVSVICSQ